MILLNETKEICKQNNIILSRSKGQNFLIEEDIYNKIIDYANLNKDDLVLEVGPGLGFLTERLAKVAKKVIAVELDNKLASFLEIKFADCPNAEIINDDVLKLNFSTIASFKNEKYHLGLKQRDPGSPARSCLAEAGGEAGMTSLVRYKIVANLPYNITSIFLRNFLSGNYAPQEMTLMLQKEVANRIVAEPGDMSLLAVSVKYYGAPKILDYVGRENFWPQPEVDSAILKIDLRKKNFLSVDKEKDFFRLVKFGFSSRRKMLKNNLAAGYQISQEIAKDRLKSVCLDEKIRAEDLAVDDWLRLFVQFG